MNFGEIFASRSVQLYQKHQRVLIHALSIRLNKERASVRLIEFFGGLFDFENAPMRPEDRRAFSLREVAEKCGVSYSVIWRAVARGDLKVLKGFGRTMVSGEELKRFLGKSETYNARRRSK
jgi:hypothetical protein